MNDNNIRTVKPLSREFVLAQVQLISDSNYTDGISKLHDMIVGKQVLIAVKGKVSCVMWFFFFLKENLYTECHWLDS